MSELLSSIGIGHWTDSTAKTGCTVVVLPTGTICSGEVRGGAPATREFALLEPSRTVGEVDAVVLSGGSAFGLAACDGVIGELEAAGRGFVTPFGRVPIVVGMSLFDLAVGDPSVRPGSEQGREACRQALDLAADEGLPLSLDGGHSVMIGAGVGATTNKWAGQPEPGGLAQATVASTHGDSEVVVHAIMAVNAFGAVDDGRSADDPGPPALPSLRPDGQPPAGQNTTIGLVVTNAKADKTSCFRMAQSAHDGLARSLLPAHTQVDGDAVVVAATGTVEADPMHLRAMVQAAVVSAVRSVRTGA